MRLYFQITFLLLVEILLTIYIYYFSGFQLEHIYAQPPMFLLPPLYSILLALLIGYVRSRLMRGKRPAISSYTFGYLSSFIIYILVSLVVFIKTTKYNQLFGYNAQNQILMASFDNDMDKGLAFKEFQSRLENPREMYLSSYFSQDTVLLENQKATIYYFTYNYEGDAAHQYFSIAKVIDSRATLLMFDQDTARSSEYRNAVNRKGHQHSLKNGKKMIVIE